MRNAQIAAALLLATTGCAEVGKVLGASFERPRLTFEGWEPREADLEGVTLALRWRIDNPNSVGLQVAGLEYRLDVEGHQAATGSAGQGMKIPGPGSAPLELPVRVRFADLPPLARAVFSRESLAWRISGEVGIGTPVGPVQIPFSHEGKVPSPRPPRLAIERVAVHDASLTGLTFDVVLRVENPNAFPLPAGALRYALSVAGAEVARDAAHPIAPVPGGKSGTLTLPVYLSFAGAGAAARRALRGEASDVVLKGQAQLGSVELPVSLQGKYAPGK